MIIIQITDCHLFSEIQKTGYNNINPYQSLRHILAEVKLRQPNVLLVTGDISGDGSGQSYQHFSKLLNETSINCRIGIIPGNHDNQTQMKTHIDSDYLWLNKPRLILPNRWHIHLLDTQYQHAMGQISESNLVSLTEYLSVYCNDYHLLAAHHHPIPCNGWMDKHEWTNRHEFNTVVAANPSIRGVVYGHIHTAIEQQEDQCLYMACPSTCWQFATESSFATSNLLPGYRVLKLLDNGQIATSIHRLKA
jgi:Icc protein